MCRGVRVEGYASVRGSAESTQGELKLPKRSRGLGRWIFIEAFSKFLQNSRRRPVRAVLHVSGDGLRVVEDETKGLIVDQTIEKVSFCAPDRNHEKGFSYICRDGTTRRWMCHGFLALKESVRCMCKVFLFDCLCQFARRKVGEK